MDPFPYLPGWESSESQPILRFMPPAPLGVVPAFLERAHLTEGWILDPFGISPAVIVELARQGRQVLVAVNNPITRFILELTASPPQLEDLRAALSHLATARKGDERMETHLQSLYATDCPRCGLQTSARAFIWEKDRDVPTARIIQCTCGEKGEFPVTEADQALARRIAATDGLHRSRALERVIPQGDPLRESAEEALECYLPRAVYALITVVNKTDQILHTLPAERQRALLALLLVACDEGNTLWPHPPERVRRRQLTVPPRYLEKNLWLALEHAVDQWGNQASVAVAQISPGGSPSAGLGTIGSTGGLYLCEGTTRHLIPAIKALQPAAVTAVLPRLSQAYWTLSTLWAGWLWGSDKAASFRVALRRRRYDWTWLEEALHNSLREISPHLPLNTPLFALLPEPEPSFLTAALLAAHEAGFEIQNLAMRSRNETVQVTWWRRAFMLAEKERPPMEETTLISALQEHLVQRGEPATYLHLHAAALLTLAEEHMLPTGQEAISTVGAAIETALASPLFVHHSDSRNVETGLWGLQDWDDSQPLSDRFEIALVHDLLQVPALSLKDLEVHLNQVFPGLLTPPADLFLAVLESYATEEGEKWSLRSEEQPLSRKNDLTGAVQNLTTLAARLGLSAQTRPDSLHTLAWEKDGQAQVVFHVLTSAVVGNLLRGWREPPERSLLVLPGSRAGLLAFKLEHDPALQMLFKGWRVLKFRQLRSLMLMKDLTFDKWEKELASDPLEPPRQMKLF